MTRERASGPLIHTSESSRRSPNSLTTTNAPEEPADGDGPRRPIRPEGRGRAEGRAASTRRGAVGGGDAGDGGGPVLAPDGPAFLHRGEAGGGVVERAEADLDVVVMQIEQPRAAIGTERAAMRGPHQAGDAEGRERPF